MVHSTVDPSFHTHKPHRPATIWLLIVVNILSLMAATSIVVVLNPEDKISKKRGGVLTALGFVYFMTLFELLNVACLHTTSGGKLRHKYRLSTGDVLDINNKLVSAVQALFCCVTGAVVCTWSCSRDFMRSSHYMSEAYAWFGAAYFFYDIWSMYMVHVEMHSSPTRRRRPDGDAAKPPAPSLLGYILHEPVILFHHLFIGGFGFLVIVYLRGDLGDCTFGFVYLMELSTPFVSLRGILSRMKLKESRAYIANGLTMLVTFFVCRVASLPYVVLMYARVLGVSYLEALESLPRGCKISILALLLPQVYWFWLMSSGALKIFLSTDRNANTKDNLSNNKLSAKLSSGDADKRS